MQRHPSLKTRLLCLILALSMVLMTACSPKTPDAGKTTEAPVETDAGTAAARAEQERFSAYTNDLFLESILDNTVNLHYTLSDPESYGITEYPITLGSYEEYTEEDILNDLDEMSVELATYDYSLLTDDQKMTYDILQHHIDTERGASDLVLYTEPLGPVTGAATQIPIVLAEYSFYREQDVIDYLQLLPHIQEYFESIIAFEERRADAGLFMPEFVLDANVDICADFLENRDQNYLILSFASRLESADWLDEQKKADYIEQNRNIVFDSVFPAFEYLSSSLESMRDFCAPEGGLCRLPEGKRYFAYMMESSLGPDRTVEEMLELIETYQQTQLNKMFTILQSVPELQTSLDSFGFTLTDPEGILNYLKDKISDDFPEIPDTSYTVKYVEKELEEVMSPAFYMIPPIDRYLENTIYINNGSVDKTTLFTTLAHEGYPGHLYQNVYFKNKNSEPLRSMLSYKGYSEGWATYVEACAYSYDPKVNKNLLTIMSLNNTVTLSIYAALDICINYLGWDRAQTEEYIEQFFGDVESEVVDEIYNAIAGDPCNYLAYHGGYLEIMEMRSIAEATLDKDFNLKEFHRFVLDLGECPFSLANNRLADWLEAQE